MKFIVLNISKTKFNNVQEKLHIDQEYLNKPMNAKILEKEEKN